MSLNSVVARERATTLPDGAAHQQRDGPAALVIPAHHLDRLFNPPAPSP
ncbi:hypothetical protein [Micromonospora sp. CB01531]|nr:hypothetical protein [Micromonospora sp. CB01531]